MNTNLNRYTQSRKEQIILNKILVNKTFDKSLINNIMLFNLEDFLPIDKCYLANSDTYIEYAEGRYMMDILTITKLLSLVNIKKSDKVLILGLGLGYLASILSVYSDEIQAIEADNDIVQQAEKNLHKYNINNVEILTKQQFNNLNTKFDYIIINGAFAELPHNIINLLATRGNVLGIERTDNLSKLVHIKNVDNQLLKNYYSQVPMPFLKGFEPPKNFTF